MKFGVVLPQNEGMRDPIVIRDFAQAVEGMGFSHLITADHVVGADPTNRPADYRTTTIYNHKTFVHEPLVLFAFLGAVTSRLEFATEIIILPLRQTVLFAKQAAEIDYLTGGRLRVGLGIGWNRVEYEALNEDFKTRGQRISEQVELLRALWTQEVVDFKGWHRVDRAGVNPLPVQRPIPIWMGGHAEAVLQRTAALADGGCHSSTRRRLQRRRWPSRSSGLPRRRAVTTGRPESRGGSASETARRTIGAGSWRTGALSARRKSARARGRPLTRRSTSIR